MLVLFKLRTDRVGCDTDEVYEIEDKYASNEDGTLNETYLNEVGYDLARDNAEMYGVQQDEEIEEEPFSYLFEVLECSREEAEELYGEVNII